MDDNKATRSVPSSIHRVSKINGNLFIVLYFFTKALPSIISGFSIYLGFKLFILGVTGQASINVEAKTISGQLLNAAPGLFFAIGGIVALVFTVWKGVSVKVDPDTVFEVMY